MNIHFTFRGIESTDALKDMAEDKLAKLKKAFLTDAADLHVILETDGHKNEHRAELNLQEKDLKTQAKAESDDMYKSIQEAVRKLERQLRRHKERRTEHHR